jgi:hypothetical protein
MGSFCRCGRDVGFTALQWLTCIESWVQWKFESLIENRINSGLPTVTTPAWSTRSPQAVTRNHR